MQYKVIPGRIFHRLKAAKVKASLSIEKAFISDEIEVHNQSILSCRRKFQQLWSQVRSFISIIDMIRLNLYISKINHKRADSDETKNSKKMKYLIHERYGSVFKSGDQHIINLSTYNLTDNEKFVLSHGLDFCIKPSYIDR